MTEVRSNCNTTDVSTTIVLHQALHHVWRNVYSGTITDGYYGVTIILDFRLWVGLNGISRGSHGDKSPRKSTFQKLIRMPLKSQPTTPKTINIIF